MKRQRVMPILAASLAAVLLSGCRSGGSLAGSGSSGTSAETITTSEVETMDQNTIRFTNPLIPPEGADPWVLFYDGYYYYCFSEENALWVTKAKNLSEIGTETPVKVYTPPETGEFTADYWAPELHYLDGKWVIYVAADDGANENHRMIALESTGGPQDTFVYKSKITDPTDKWAIDGTVVSIKDRLYFVWSGWEGDVNVAQNLYIAPMNDPYTIAGDRVKISEPTYDWETVGDPHVNEGPEALMKGDTVHIVYSASGSWTDDYCLGLLTLTGDDPLDPAAWSKTPEPVFSKALSAYGPGHCSFTTSPDGETDWIVYHACQVPGSGWAGRSVRAQPFTWDGDTPVFGKPAPLTEQQVIAKNNG